MTGHHVQLVLSHPSQTTMDACHLSWLLSLTQQSWLRQMHSANPNQTADHPTQAALACEAMPQQVAWSAALLDESEQHQLQGDTAVYNDYWQRFQDIDEAAATASYARSIVPDCKVVKVL